MFKIYQGGIEVQCRSLSATSEAAGVFTDQNVLMKINFEDIGRVSDGLPYSFYQQFAHIHIAQPDILEYCTKED